MMLRSARSVFILACGLLFLAVWPSTANITVPDASIALKIRQDPFAEKFRRIEAKASSGDVDAKADLGELLWRAKGAEQNITRASTSLHEAAQAGNARAAYLLGQIISERRHGVGRSPSVIDPLGTGIHDDPLTWLRQAADTGMPEMQLALAEELFILLSER